MHINYTYVLYCSCNLGLEHCNLSWNLELVLTKIDDYNVELVGKWD